VTTDDMRINREVRHLLTRKWIKLQRLSFNCVSGTLYIHGRIELMREPNTARTEKVTDQFGVGPKFLIQLERDLLKIGGLRAVRWDIMGWHKGSMGWSHRGL